MAGETQPSETKTTAETGLPPSLLSTADSGKHEHAAPNGKDAPVEVKAEAPAPEVKPEPKTEPKPEEGKKESPAESGDKPPETKPEAKEPPKADEKVEPEKKPEDKAKETAEAKPETKEEPKPEAPKEPLVAPTYDKLTLPENVKLDDSRVAKFDELVGKAELAAKTGDPHAAIAALRQDAVNFHIEEINNVVKAVQKNQVDVWNKLVEQRVNELKSDPELGGNRIETSLGNAKYALESLIPGFTKDEATELIGIMDKGGVSHHRLTIKMLNSLYNLLAEPEPVNNGQPLNQRQSKDAGSRGWYDKVDAKTA